MARLTAKKEQWFSIPGDTDKAKLKVLHLCPGDVEKIEAETSRWVGKRAAHEFVSELEYSPQAKLRKLRIASIIDWDGFYDEDGNKLKCSSKNIELYLDHDPELGADPDDGNNPKPFSEWVDTFRLQLSETAASEEEVEKN